MKKGWIFIAALLILLGSWYIGSSLLSRETLDAFDTLNERVEYANADTSSRVDSLSKELSKTSFVGFSQQTKTLDSASVRLDNYIEAIKSDLLKNLKDPNDYGSMDQSQKLDVLFFDGNELTEGGKNFLSEIQLYNKTISETFATDFPVLVEETQTIFNTLDVTNRRGEKVNWLRYHFEGFPMIASVTKFTQLQADVRQTRQTFLERILAPD